MMNASGRSTITLSRRTISRLKKLKKEFGVDSYDELINLLIDRSKESMIGEALSSAVLTEEEAREVWKVIKERRESWWRRSY